MKTNKSIIKHYKTLLWGQKPRVNIVNTNRTWIIEIFYFLYHKYIFVTFPGIPADRDCQCGEHKYIGIKSSKFCNSNYCHFSLIVWLLINTPMLHWRHFSMTSCYAGLILPSGPSGGFQDIEWSVFGHLAHLKGRLNQTVSRLVSDNWAMWVRELQVHCNQNGNTHWS